MQKIGSSTSTANGAGEFTSGQPGSGIDATMIMAAWLNTIQRELVNVVQGAGLVLNPADDTQVLKAIKALQELGSAWAKITGKPTTIGGFGITDAFTKVETSNAIHQAVSDLVASSPESLDTLKELADALGGDPHFATTVLNALAEKAVKATDLPGYGIIPASPAEVGAGLDNTKPVTAAGLVTADPWSLQPIGVPIGLFTDIALDSVPPSNKSYRYISLSADDGYNAGVLTGETVTGTGPLLEATAVINLPGSPLNGKTVRLINTERRVLRAGASGMVENDQSQGFVFASTDGQPLAFHSSGVSVPSTGTNAGREPAFRTPDGSVWRPAIVANDGTNGAPRVGTETRSKNIGVTIFLRIK